MRERSVVRACQWCQFSMTRMHLKCEKLPRVVVAFQRGFCLEKTKHQNNIICESTKKKIMWIWSQCLFQLLSPLWILGCELHCHRSESAGKDTYLRGEIWGLVQQHTDFLQILYLTPFCSLMSESVYQQLYLNSFDPLQTHFPGFRRGLCPSSKHLMERHSPGAVCMLS